MKKVALVSMLSSDPKSAAVVAPYIVTTATAALRQTGRVTPQYTAIWAAVNYGACVNPAVVVPWLCRGSGGRIFPRKDKELEPFPEKSCRGCAVVGPAGKSKRIRWYAARALR